VSSRESSSSTRRIKPDSSSRSISPDAKDLRISQLLADEVWSEELEALATSPITYDDYTRQVKEILEAEKEELLETAAILSAPPGADSVAVEEQEPRPSISLRDVNATSVLGGAGGSSISNSSISDGAGVEMDFNSYMEAVKAEEELLETQAILNAPPAAESVDLPEREVFISLEEFAVSSEPETEKDPDDDLAILEMDDDSIGTKSLRKSTRQREAGSREEEETPSGRATISIEGAGKVTKAEKSTEGVEMSQDASKEDGEGPPNDDDESGS
jgi:hypothetical protein